jgi:HAD superfamily hydrolase (TIGR01509 family)
MDRHRSSGARIDELAVGWRGSFRAARDALDAASDLPAAERAERGARLRDELASTQASLAAFARAIGAGRFLPLVVSALDARRLLGLPPEVQACVFNLDGVLVGSASLHSAAWAAALDPFLAERAERTHGTFPPFNPRVDYVAHLHARPRLAGARAFLASRGVRLPEGTPYDRPGTETVNGVANAKSAALIRLLDDRGIDAFEGSRSYLALAHEAGIRCAVVSASANTTTILERSGLTELVDASVDGKTIERDRLRVKPEPDTLLAACRLVGVEPRRSAAFETTRAGVEAGRSAGFDLVVGVDGSTGADSRAALHAAGADVVVSDVGDILERRQAA